MRFCLSLVITLALCSLAPAQGPPANPSAADTLAEVNALRARRGLPPYQLDVELTKGAIACAQFRAKNRVSGHTGNDFGFLPAGTSAVGAGCAAWPAALGWGSCAIYERHQFAGAAWALGGDGLRYMHLFVR